MHIIQVKKKNTQIRVHMEINFSYSKIPFIFGERMALEMQICAVLSQLDMKCGGKKKSCAAS